MPRANMNQFVGKPIDPVVSPDPEAVVIVPAERPESRAESKSEPSVTRITFDAPAHLRAEYKAWCSVHGTSVRKHLTAFIESTLRD